MARSAWFASVSSKEKAHKKGKKSDASPRNTTPYHGIASLTMHAGSSWVDPHESRDPPPDATPLTFPPNVLFENSDWTKDSPPPDLQSLFAKIVRPGDIHDDHATALNINVLENCDVEDLIPKAKDGSSYIPSPDDSADPARTFLTSYADAAKSDGATTRKRKDFMDRYTELQIDNDAAFCAINKIPLMGGARHPRLAHMRKFWEGIENMSRYWDCSMDYYYTCDSSEEEQNRVKRQRIDSESSKAGTSHVASWITDSITPVQSVEVENGIQADAEQDNGSLQDDQHDFSPQSPAPDINKLARNASFTPPKSPGQKIGLEMLSDEPHQAPTAETTSTDRPDNIDNQPAPDPGNPPDSVSEGPKRMRYRGRRTSTGSKMPDQFRTETVTGFVEGVVWAFAYTVKTPRVISRIQIGRLNVPVRQTAAIYRLPEDRSKARKGIVQGPAFAMQTRPETDFRQDDQKAYMATVRLDLLREVGALLQIAQERSREGLTEVKPGEGKWWTTKPRWGGGPGGEAQNDDGNTDVTGETIDVTDVEKSDDSSRPKRRSRSTKKPTPSMLWKELKCGTGRWDSKVNYSAIGKDHNSPYDEVFLVSSLNHHIAILKMTVHSAYLDYLATGTLSEPAPSETDWCRPKLQRSQWFDVFKKEDRCTVFQGLWGVLEYLTRDIDAVSTEHESHDHAGK